MTTRAEIAATLTGTGIVTGSEFRPSTLASGMAWPRATAHDWAAASHAFETTWSIYVVLPQEERAATIWFEDNIETLRDALETVAFVDHDEPIMLPVTNSDDLFALLITARSE
jgi:hypothetical protein